MKRMKSMHSCYDRTGEPMKNGLNLEAFLADFAPGLKPRALITRIRAGAIPIELTAAGGIPAEPRVLCCLALTLPLLFRRARGLTTRVLWDRVHRALVEA